jgi:hypothetical protein
MVGLICLFKDCWSQLRELEKGVNPIRLRLKWSHRVRRAQLIMRASVLRFSIFVDNYNIARVNV